MAHARNPLDDWLDTKCPGKSGKQYAEMFGLRPPQFSRIRSGRASLTEERARVFARNLVGGNGGAGSVDKLTQELLAVATSVMRDEQQASPARIAELFERLCHGGLLCVDYRDMPQAFQGAPYEKRAAPAGRAVAHGMSFAMFSPFGSPGALSDSRDLPPVVRSAAANIAAQTRESYRKIRAEALNVRNEPDLIDARLVLYEREAVCQLPVGFQSRLFVAVPPGPYGPRPAELWEWITTPNGGLFVQRDGLQQDAVMEQFFPVTTAWEVHRALPQTKPEIAKAQRALAHRVGLKHPPASSWTVFRETMT